uniref:Uncharacterized protein n=1 Tax=Marseillevirus LCMAC101 TaxID=2506602 RepID=A0A481YS51_9VIRU|nr:MAG: hypothetical protein LCMAC101_03720 [Marseillevirus LCMAC101]
MSEQEAWITNERYTNEKVIWSEPKGLLYGDFVGAKPAQKANLFPDKSATYFVINICLPPGGSLTLSGQYPHARYVSFTIANQLGGGQLGNGTYIRGDHIIPDPGSHNPFWSTNYRNVTARNYTLYIVQGDQPDDFPNNTLYTGTNSEKERIHLSIRTYLADQLYDGTGNVKLAGTGYGLPEVVLNLGGSTITGPILVKILRATKMGDPNGYQLQQWLSDIENSTDKINAPCLPVPVSQVFWNTDYSVTGAFDAEHPEERVRNYPPNRDGGFANNPDARYMLMPFSFGFGEVLVVRARMPTHPNTRQGGNILPEDPQVQYFSVSTATAPSYGAGWDTVCDEQIPVDQYGNYTIVVSWPWNRPANAILKNGIIWLSPGGGEGHYVGARNWVGLLYFRFQNSNSGWKESPANIPMPSIEKPIPQDPFVMGPYYPRGRYMSTADFETEFKNNRVGAVPPAA